MKYIMFQHTENGVIRNIPVIFPNELVHSDVALALRRIRFMREHTVRSAGSLNLGATANLMAYGDSETLKVKAHEDDTHIIGCHDWLHGIEDDSAITNDLAEMIRRGR